MTVPAGRVHSAIKGSDERRIAKLAVKNKWSAGKVKEAVQEANGRAAGGRTREEVPPAVDALQRLQLRLRDLRAVRATFTDITDDDLRWMVGALDAARNGIDQVLDELGSEWTRRGHEGSPHPGEAAVAVTLDEADELLKLVGAED